MSKAQSISFKEIFVKGAVIFNPVLVQLAGLCPVITAATSLKNAALLSAAFCAEIIICCVAASAFLKKLPRWGRVPAYLILGLAVACPILYYIESNVLIDLSLSMKIFLPLIAVNSITAVHCEQFAVKNSIKLAFYDAAAVGIGASVVFVITGTLREMFGNGTIGGIKVNIPVTFKGMLMPFGCLILLGFTAAILKAFIMKRYPEYLEEGITFKSVAASSVQTEEIRSHTSADVKETEPEEIPEEEIKEEKDYAPVEVYDELWTDIEPLEEIPEITEIPALSEKEFDISDFDELFRSLELEIEKKTGGDKQ